MDHEYTTEQLAGMLEMYRVFYNHIREVENKAFGPKRGAFIRQPINTVSPNNL